MQSARRHAPESMAQFVARRNAEVTDRERAYAEGNARWSISTRSGGNYWAPTTMDVVALGGAPVQRVVQRLPDQVEPGWAQRAFSRFARPVAETAVGAHDCVSCHGRVRPPMPGIPWSPFPPPRDPPVSRDTPKDPPARGPKEAPKQCDVQHDNDTEICVRQPNSTARAMCHSSAMERYSWCKRTGGEVGWPELFTHPDGPRR